MPRCALLMCPLVIVDIDYVSDINECVVNLNLCQNGVCVNTDGSFLCLCSVGYVLNPEEQSCTGKLSDNPT